MRPVIASTGRRARRRRARRARVVERGRRPCRRTTRRFRSWARPVRAAGHDVGVAVGDVAARAAATPCSAHDLQMPVHAVWQQTPCSQKSERHSLLVEADGAGRLEAAGAVRRTRPATGTRSSAVHDGRHAFAPHVIREAGLRRGRHARPGAVAGRQRRDCCVAAGQLAARHAVPEAYRWQAPASHLPFVPQRRRVLHGAACRRDRSCRWRRSSSHPAWPATHDLHAPVHAWSQQTPCAQKLLLHSSGAEHDRAVVFLAARVHRAAVRRQALRVGACRR